jgi:AraC-like DNA-binding protein/quercetin dioxygenase-like cupin family protein
MSGTRQEYRALTTDQEPFLSVRSLATTYSSGYVIEPHEHRWHQLLFARSGAMTLTMDSSSWMLPSGKAALIAAGCRHSIRMWGDVDMRTLFLPPEVTLATADCAVISVTPLLREVILRIVECHALDARIAGDSHLLELLKDEMTTAPVMPLMLPLPVSPASAAAAQIIADPSTTDSLDECARRCGVGRRTLERLFVAETGMSFGLWRQKARLLASIRLLAEGRSVTEAALECGYTSISAYISAFRRTFGYTPGKLARDSEAMELLG